MGPHMFDDVGKGLAVLAVIILGIGWLIGHFF